MKSDLYKIFGVILLFAICGLGCRKNGTDQPQLTKDDGNVFTQTNDLNDNKLLQFARNENGSLSFVNSYNTKGTGSSNGLGNQGSVTLSDDKKFIFVTNATSNTVNSFKLDNNKLVFIGVYPSGGIKPVSVTQSGGLVYVLNSGSDDISGFKLSVTGELTLLSGSLTRLSDKSVSAAQVSFIYPHVLVVTEKASNMITTFTLNDDGIPVTKQSFKSTINTPYGFGVGSKGRIYVTEENAGGIGGGGVSSYNVSKSGILTSISSVKTGQAGVCWAVVDPEEKIVYATNTASNTISNFALTGAGELTNHNIIQSFTGSIFPIDIALSSKSNFLYVLTASNKLMGFLVSGNTINALTFAPGIDIPAGGNGIAAY